MTALRCSVSALALVLASTAASAQDAPPGAAASDCDINAFTPIISERTGEVLYWINPTCTAGTGGSGTEPQPPAAPAPAQAPPAPEPPAPAPPAPPPPDNDAPPEDDNGGNGYDVV
ncbi:hypothetical protein HUK65_08145 [Rhodobacteraceae bacterium 2376]|uniref:Uncharacterized protein n=1 Tax=Rhabdonatronobacter sediminivivens TaxID=2743469 RepID=A0A7Z0KY35_9RHOB|nr:hypothetical protein [Rhabdonatronobacter sediminivivens]NYS24964.1 hypothetical protein [Rhabdonatronobacter sediminivivens]